MEKVNGATVNGKAIGRDRVPSPHGQTITALVGGWLLLGIVRVKVTIPDNSMQNTHSTHLPSMQDCGHYILIMFGVGILARKMN